MLYNSKSRHAELQYTLICNILLYDIGISMILYRVESILSVHIDIHVEIL